MKHYIKSACQIKHWSRFLFNDSNQHVKQPLCSFLGTIYNFLHIYCTTGCAAVLDDYDDGNDVRDHEQTVWSQPTSEDVDIDLKVIVPTGYVFAIDRLHPSHVLWQQKV